MSVHLFQAVSIAGEPIELSGYRGKVLLIVNTASRCGYSRQFADLQKLYESRKERGFELLAFPCDQFNGKEPGTDAEIREVCERVNGLTFPLFAKTEVRGPTAHPLFRYLSERAPFQGFDVGSGGGEKMERFVRDNYPDIYAGNGVKWNFSKFLIDSEGEVRGRFECTVEPIELEPAIDALLASSR